MLKSLILSIAIVMFGVTCTVAGESVAWVDSFQGKADNYVLLRGGKTTPVAIYLSLEVGDELSVNHEDYSLQLSYADGRTGIVTMKNSPFKITGDIKTPSVAKNMLAWLGRSLNDWYADGGSDASSIEMRSRDPNLFSKPTLEAPLFSQNNNFIVAGERQLTIPWKGGRGPYAVSLVEIGTNETLFHVSEVEGSRVKIGAVALKAGSSYKLEINDIGEKITTSIVAKGKSELPEIPKDLSEAHLPEDMKTTIIAAWLAGIHSDWVLEAYQSITENSGSYFPAQLLRDSLEEGRKPE